ncbi:MAG: multidrug transporter [Oscillospiraceae bacterium]
MNIKESDWKIFRAKVPDWQETYMENLIKEYISLLSEEKLASDKFWELESLVKKDKRRPGVIIEMRRSKMIYNIIALLNDNVITFDDLNDFSEELRETIKFFITNL